MRFLSPTLNRRDVHARRRPDLIGRGFAADVDIDEVIEALRSIPRHFANLSFSNSGKTIAATSTLTTMLGTKCPANQAVTVEEIDCGLDGTNSAQAPGIVDMTHCTYATNPPGTSSTSTTAIASDSGRPESIQSTTGKTWSAEPTVKGGAPWKSFLVPTYMGSAIAPLPMLRPMILKGGGGLSVAVTLPAAVTANFTGTTLQTE
jgi:hypothetical protein